MEFPGFTDIGVTRLTATATYYRARREADGVPVSIAVGNAPLVEPEAIGAFTARVERLKQLQGNPSLEAVLDAGLSEDGNAYVITSGADGDTLAHRLRLGGAFPVRDALAVGSTLARALQSAHDAGVVHGALDPEAVVFPAPDWAVVAGFPAVAPAAPNPGWSAPESRAGRPPRSAADQFGLARIVYAMLAGRVEAFPGTAAAPWPALARAEVPGQVAAAVSRALDPDPDRRFGSVGEFGAALAAGVATDVRATHAGGGGTPGAEPIEPVATAATTASGDRSSPRGDDPPTDAEDASALTSHPIFVAAPPRRSRFGRFLPFTVRDPQVWIGRLLFFGFPVVWAFMYFGSANDGPNGASSLQAADLVTVDEFATGSVPVSLGVSPDGSRIYTFNCGDGTVSVLDSAGRTVATASVVDRGAAAAGGATAATTAPAGVLDGCTETPAIALAVSVDGERVYVVDAPTATLAVLDRDGRVVRRRVLQGQPRGVAVPDTASSVYVTTSLPSGVAVLDRDGRDVSTMHSTGHPWGAVWVRQWGQLAVGSRSPGSMIYLDATGVTQNVDPAWDDVGPLAVDRFNDHLFVGEGRVLWSSHNHSVGQWNGLAVGGGPIYGLATGSGTGTGSVAYATSSGDGDWLSVVFPDQGRLVGSDPESNQPSSRAGAARALRLPAGSSPRGVGVSPDGRRIYVALAGSDQVLVLAPTTPEDGS